jgi:hypothetical protein
VSSVVKFRAAVVFGFEEVMGPAQDFFDGGDEVFLIGCKVSESVGYIINVRSRRGGSSEKVRS